MLGIFFLELLFFSGSFIKCSDSFHSLKPVEVSEELTIPYGRIREYMKNHEDSDSDTDHNHVPSFVEERMTLKE